MKNDKIKTSFDSPEGPKARDNKTGILIAFFFHYSWEMACNTMLNNVLKSSIIIILNQG